MSVASTFTSVLPTHGSKYQAGIFEISVETEEVDDMLEHLLEIIDDFGLERFLEEDVGEYMRQQIKSRFATEGDVASGIWQPLHEATEEMRAALGYGRAHPINRRTDDLYNFVTGQYPARMGLGWAEIDIPGSPPDAVLDKKIHTAQEGEWQNPIPSFGPTVARPVLAIDMNDVSSILMMLEHRLIIDIAVGIM